MLFAIGSLLLLILIVWIKGNSNTSAPITHNPAATNFNQLISSPTPTHLKDILIATDSNISDRKISGEIICTCGHNNFQIDFVGEETDYNSIKLTKIDNGYYLIVKVRCLNCNKEHLIFDHDFHGWNGYVCTDNHKRSLPRPLAKTLTCHKCNGTSHYVKLKIESLGKEDFISETEGGFPSEEWVEAFSWITISTECNTCGAKNKDWISCETM